MEQSLIMAAAAAIQELDGYEPEELYAELEIRRRAIVANPKVAGSFDVAGEYRSVVGDSLELLSSLGKNFFGKFSRDCFQLACGDDQDSAEIRGQLWHAFTDQSNFAVLLAAAAVAYGGWSPALATVGALLVTKLIVKNAKEALCEEWRKKLPVA